MKLRYLFSIILSALFFAGCADISTDSWDNIKLSQTYVSIPAGGGSTNVTINATEDWAFVVGEDWPAWLTVDKLTGAAGESTVSFSAEAVNGGRSAELQIKAGSNTQFVNVCQGSKSVTKATVAEIIAGPEGKLYEVRGVCTSVANTTYGNWYLKDDSTDKELYIYGTVDASGKYNWASFNIEPGDVVTVQGSYVLYSGTTPEFVDATFIKVEKSLVKVVTESRIAAKDGENLEVKVAYKGAGIFPSVPEEYRSWVSIVDMKYKKGEATKIEPNPADTAIVNVAVLANPGGPRAAKVDFASGNSSVSYDFEQDGSLLQIEDGYYWLIANNAGANVAASPVPADKGYGYLDVAQATATSAPGASAFLFTAVEGGYTIQDLSGRYYYQKGTYNNFNVSKDLPASGHVWILIANEDGTVKVQNTEVKKYIQFDSSYNSWGSYDSAKGILPSLVKAVAPVIADGEYYIEVSAGVVTPLPADKKYGYLNVAEKSADNAFTFKFTEGKGYTICGTDGRYLYQTGTYNSFNVSTDPTEGQYWTIIPQADGTVKIQNPSVNKWWQYSTSYKSFGSYDTVQSGSELPKLVFIK